MPEEKNPILKGGLLVIYITVSSYLLVLLALYAGGARESTEYFQKSTFYYALLAGCMIGFLALYIMKSFKAKFGYAFVHSPDEGWLANVKSFQFLRSPAKIFFVGTILFSLLGLAGVMNNQIWTGLPTISQQITETSEIIIAVQPASDAETIAGVFVLFLVMSILYFIKNKYKFGKTFIISTSLLVAIPIRCAFDVAIHFARYGAEEGGLYGVAITRYAISLFTLASGSVIFELLWHSLNNFFFKLSKMFSDEIIWITTLFILGAFVAIGILIWIRSRKK